MTDGAAREAAKRSEARVLVAASNKIVREGIRSALQGNGARVVAEATTAGEAIEAVARWRPEVVLLDAELPDRSCPDVCAAILAERSATAIVVLSASRRPFSVRAALAAGARGYLVTDSDDLDLRRAIDRALAGETVVDPAAAAAIVETDADDQPRLTPQELSVMRLVAEGLTNPEIGERLYLSRHTVKEYVSHAMRKLAATNRMEAVRRAAALGLIEGVGTAARSDVETPPRTLVYNDSGTRPRASEIKVPPLKVDKLELARSDET